MGNMIINVCEKSNYYLLRIDKAFWILKIDNKNKNNFRSDWGFFWVQKYEVVIYKLSALSVS